MEDVAGAGGVDGLDREGRGVKQLTLMGAPAPLGATGDQGEAPVLFVEGQGRLTHGYSDTRAIRSATSTNGDDVQLALTDGPLSQFIRSLGLKKLLY